LDGNSIVWLEEVKIVSICCTRIN